MENDHKKTNIFDEASKSAKKGSEKHSLPLSHLSAKIKSSPPPSDTETEQMIGKMREMSNSLQEKIDKVCSLVEMPKDEVMQYIDNPSNFPPEEWQRMQRETEKLENTITETLGTIAKEKKKKKKKEILDKARKGKTLGSRKGWIQM